MALPVSRILMTDGINVQCAEILRSQGLHVTVAPKMSKDELIKQLESHDTLLVRSATKVTSQVIQAAPTLKLIGRAGTGVDNIDLDSATRHGVLVMNTPGGNTLSAAEHTCVMIAALSRNLVTACTSLKDGKWERSKFMGSELYGKTLAVLGLGRIGREVAHRMRSFGMKVIGFDPMVSAEAAREFHVEKRELDQIWPDADYITVHTPLIPQTRNLISADSLSRCKRGVRVVNVARGGIVDEAALLAALESGQCAGAGLDVFAEEPPTDLRLVRHPAVICTPHLGANTGEAQRRVAVELAEQICTAVRGGPLAGLANAACLTSALSGESRPWLQLGRALGAVTGQLAGVGSGRPFELQVTLRGQEMSHMRPFLGSSVLVGLMSGMTQNGVNLISAPLLAREAGIRVTCLLEDPEATARTVTVTVELDGRRHTTNGTVQGEQATLLELDGSVFESGVTLGGNMLFFQADGSGAALTELISTLAAAQAQLQSVLTSSGTSGKPLVAVRTQSKLETPELLQTQHAKFMLQTEF
ncbi:D-3-phosphoglycerate dehydrogenase [Amphibalanus amphitrite]|uniref:D-3-phosphoglycerate dehydrogenase n=1 Tax=Amphibalanus amphitrite TaxID=1232801 RepID=A0A6A4VJM9_AMPAM|nr:D-3-phosphoglycerate dehydrogenase [Amphibalanus amphitrite]